MTDRIGRPWEFARGDYGLGVDSIDEDYDCRSVAGTQDSFDPDSHMAARHNMALDIPTWQCGLSVEDHS